MTDIEVAPGPQNPTTTPGGLVRQIARIQAIIKASRRYYGDPKIVVPRNDVRLRDRANLHNSGWFEVDVADFDCDSRRNTAPRRRKVNATHCSTHESALQFTTTYDLDKLVSCSKNSVTGVRPIPIRGGGTGVAKIRSLVQP